MSDEIDFLLVLEAVDRHWPRVDTLAIAEKYGWPESIVASALARIRDARAAHRAIMCAEQVSHQSAHDVTAQWMGDPPPGRSALDQRRSA